MSPRRPSRAAAEPLRPTATTVRQVLDQWETHRQRIQKGLAYPCIEAGWTSFPVVSASTDLVVRLVMDPEVRQAAPLLKTLLEGIQPSHWPLMEATRVWLLHRTLDAWVAATTLGSDERCALMKVFLDAPTSPNGDRQVVAESPLHQAVRLGDVALVQLLADAGANLQERLPMPAPDANGRPTLLVSHPERFPDKRWVGETLLHLAAIHDDVAMCARLIALGLPLGAEPLPDGRPGRTPAQAARSNESFAALATLEAVELRAATSDAPALPAAPPARRL